MLNERGSHQSNLINFLDGVTPVVPTRHLPKGSVMNLNRLWHPWERETIEYFNLADLWHSYSEWSAYGTGASIRLNNRETVQQYYVPSLSAIQIFTSTRTRDLFCDNFHKENGNARTWTLDDCLSDNSTLEQKSQWRPNNRLGRLYFQYFEKSSPYNRVPMVDKINSFTAKFPWIGDSKKHRSFTGKLDVSCLGNLALLCPKSNVDKRYPIYHIPTQRTVKDLAACFLTYHTLSSSFLDMGFDEEIGIRGRAEKKRNGFSLVPFGLAAYKMQGNIWLSDKAGRDRDTLVSLLSAADSWLKQLRVDQPDFTYFTKRQY